MADTMEVQLVDGATDHQVHVVLGGCRILQVAYKNHPGLNTQALSYAYVAQRRGKPGTICCLCATFADSLYQRLYWHVASLLVRQVPNYKVTEIRAWEKRAVSLRQMRNTKAST